MHLDFAHGRLARQLARGGRVRHPISCTRSGAITIVSNVLQQNRRGLCWPNAANMLLIVRTIPRGGRTEPPRRKLPMDAARRHV